MPFIQETVVDYLGVGLTYPIILENGRAQVRTGRELIESCIKIIVSWPFGDRIMLGEFGSKLESVLEEQNTTVLEARIRNLFKDAIDMWEKRIEFIDIQFVQNGPTKKEAHIYYRIVNSQQPETFIFPFYKNIDY